MDEELDIDDNDKSLVESNETLEDVKDDENLLDTSENVNESLLNISDNNKDNTENIKHMSMKKSTFPLARLKSMIKSDRDVNSISSQALIAYDKVTQLFVESFSKQICEYMMSSKKKTMKKSDIDYVVNNTDNLCFLEDLLE